jgi:hypothetical protein
MNQVDPMADKYSSHTPYNFAFNRPNMVTDVNGADPTGTGVMLWNGGRNPYINNHMDADHEGSQYGYVMSTTNLSFLADNDEMFGDFVGNLYDPYSDAARGMGTDEFAAKYGQSVGSLSDGYAALGLSRPGYVSSGAFGGTMASINDEDYYNLNSGDPNMAKVMSVVSQYYMYGEKNSINWIIDYGKKEIQPGDGGVTDPYLTNGKGMFI